MQTLVFLRACSAAIGALIGVLRKTLAVPTVARSASEWGASLSLALRATVRNTPIKAIGHRIGCGVCRIAQTL